jgi:hypothetical protein
MVIEITQHFRFERDNQEQYVKGEMILNLQLNIHHKYERLPIKSVMFIEQNESGGVHKLGPINK